MNPQPVRTDNDFSKFTRTWKGGYYEGNPLDPMARSSYLAVGYNSVLYTTYLACIRPYVSHRTTAIEIGPGRGAWTKAILARNPSRIYVLDAAPPQHTRFWEYVGKDDRIEYLTAADFSMDGVPDKSADFFFSFGVFCHLKPEQSRAYISSLYTKMAPGGNCFLMIGDFDKFNSLIENVNRYSIYRIVEGRPLVGMAYRFLQMLLPRKFFNFTPVEKPATQCSSAPWYHLGIDEACEHIERVGFRIVEKDVQVNSRDPMIHFQMPQK